MSKTTTMTAADLSTASATHLTVSERKAITKGILSCDLLRGLDRTKTKGQALGAINAILNEQGFFLNMVPGDIIMGDHGNRSLPFSRQGQDQSIENASITFVWEELSGIKWGAKRWEFIAYVS